MSSPEIVDPEFNVPANLEELGRNGKVFHLSADENVRKKIAVRLKIPSVEQLEGTVRLSATKTAINAKGDLRAVLTRECVSSLELMSETVEESFDITFSRGEASSMNEGDEADWEAAEIHDGDIFDLGELLVQQLSLSMTAFPRKIGAPSLADQYGNDDEAPAFAILKGVLQKSEQNQ